MSTTSGDWAAQAVDAIDRVVQKVRQNATGPVLTVLRAVVYGTITAIVGFVALILLAIAAVRLLDQLPGGSWVAHTITGSIFTLAGLLLMRMRHRAVAEEA